jgi:hypothetical protein
LRGCRASKGLCLSTRIGSDDRHSEEIQACKSPRPVQ